MAYHFDQYDRSLVIDGFEKGIADSPYQGISDERNVNIISVPGEASVNFATIKISPSVIGTGTVSSADDTTEIITFSGATGLETYMAITFTGASLPTGITAGTIYWASVLSPTTMKIYSDYQMASVVNITATGTGTFHTVDMSTPKYFATDGKGKGESPNASGYWMVDSSGQVWSNNYVTTSNFWTFTGNKVNTYSNGNGLVYYESSNGTGYIFLFHNSSIDYTPSNATNISWVYQWAPASGTVGSWSATPTAILKTGVGSANSHEAMTAPDSRVYYCDANWVGRWYQTSPTVAFVPTTLATYTYDQTSLLPTTDLANCLAFLGTNILVGGFKNIVYPWDRFSTNYTYPILLAESVISKMVTVNTNTYIFVGNRGRIYITNGSQAQLFKKIPDHLSGTVEPYYQWGGATSTKNQLYFSALVTTNGGVANLQYGGVWGIDVDTKAIRLTNKLSYNTYDGYASALIAVTPNLTNQGNPSGTGMLIGWKSSNTSPTYGIDRTSSSPYVNSEATIDSDLIPVGTFDKTRDFSRIEFKLSTPLVSGESVTIQYRLDFSQSYTTIITDSTVGDFSSSGSLNFKNAQWLQLRAILNSTASSPSYTRLREIRITGLALQ